VKSIMFKRFETTLPAHVIENGNEIVLEFNSFPNFRNGEELSYKDDAGKTVHVQLEKAMQVSQKGVYGMTMTAHCKKLKKDAQTA
jgi:urease accessory protein UreE